MWLMVCAGVVSPARGQEVREARGLTEPYRTIEVATAESGVIAELNVRQTQAVRRGQVLAKLDCDVHLALLAIAKQAMEAEGTLNSALAEVQLRQERLKNFQAVFDKGHARQEEVARAQTELAVSEAQQLAAEEELQHKKLEYRKIMVQLQRRTLRAPIDGVVSAMHKEQGEYLAPNTPALLTLVQLDPLLAVFSLPSAHARQMRIGQEVELRFFDPPDTAPGKVDMIARTTDPESGTVLVKIRIANPTSRYRSGERCSLVECGETTPEAADESPGAEGGRPETGDEGQEAGESPRMTHQALSSKYQALTI
jgi:RND family efflux transporter MFP subunit